jgi:hypothetical protein
MGTASLSSPVCNFEGRIPLNNHFVFILLTTSKCFLEAGNDFCKLDYNEEDLSDLTINLDRSKILTTGREGTQVHLSYMRRISC